MNTKSATASRSPVSIRRGQTIRAYTMEEEEEEEEEQFIYHK